VEAGQEKKWGPENRLEGRILREKIGRVVSSYLGLHFGRQDSERGGVEPGERRAVFANKVFKGE